MNSTAPARTQSTEERRQAFERAAEVARDYAREARRLFRGTEQAADDLADFIVQNEVALDGGADAVLLRDDSLFKVLRNLHTLRVSVGKNAKVQPADRDAISLDLPETVLVDVTAIIDHDAPYIDQFTTETFYQEIYVSGWGTKPARIICTATQLEYVNDRYLLAMAVTSEMGDQ
jgi:hypothetical protein